MNNLDKEEQKKRIIKICIYVGFFIFVIILLRLSNVNKNNTNKDNSNDTGIIDNDKKIIDNILNISNDNYEENIYYSMDDDALTLEFQKSKDIIIGTKSYHGIKTTFVNKNNQYYQVDEINSNLSPINNFNYFEYDKTFIDILNIKKMLNLRVNPTKEDNKIIYKYNISDLLSIYNSYNNTTYFDLGKGYVTLEVYYTDNTLNYILINTTDLYNKVNNKDLNEVLYKIKINESNEEDISWLEELLK